MNIFDCVLRLPTDMRYVYRVGFYNGVYQITKEHFDDSASVQQTPETATLGTMQTGHEAITWCLKDMERELKDAEPYYD